MKKMKRFAALALALLMLVSCSSGDDGKVSETQDGADTTAPETVAETNEREAIRENVPAVRFDGTDFRTLVRDQDNWIKDLFVYESSADVVDNAVYKRNAAIEERFGIKFVHTTSSNNDHETDLLPLVSSGTDAYELVMPHGRVPIEYAQQNILIDWNEFEYVDLTKPWWSATVSEEFRIMDKLFFTTGSLSYLSLSYTQALCFNKEIFTEYGVEYPYQMVKDGKWTYDVFSNYAKQMTKDLDGADMIEYENDQLGYITHQWMGPINVLFSQGGHVVTKDSDGYVVLDYYNDRTLDIFDRFFELVDSDAGYVYRDGKSTGKDVVVVFGEGKAAFLEYNVSVLEQLRQFETDFGVLPSPKFDESQDKYYGILNAGVHLFCVPTTAYERREMIGIILEAWAAEAYRLTIPAYYDVALSTKYTRDNESEDMLDLIMDGTTVDIVYFTNGVSSFSNIAMSLLDGTHDFTSYYRSGEKQTNKQLEKLMEKFAGEAE